MRFLLRRISLIILDLILVGCGVIKDNRGCSFKVEADRVVVTYSKFEVYVIPYDSTDKDGLDKALDKYFNNRDLYRVWD